MQCSARAPTRVRTAWAATSSPTTHWWDSSQIYGASRRSPLRSGEHGKLRIDDLGCRRSSRRTSTWPGSNRELLVRLALLHSSSCRAQRRLRPHAEKHPSSAMSSTTSPPRRRGGDGEDPVDWTPAIIAHPRRPCSASARTGEVEGERLDKRRHRTKNEVLRGITGSPTNHRAFVLADRVRRGHRMHPLIPDGYSCVRSPTTACCATSPAGLNAVPNARAAGETPMNLACSSGRRTRARHMHNYRDFRSDSSGPTARCSTSPDRVPRGMACRAPTSSAGSHLNRSDVEAGRAAGGRRAAARAPRRRRRVDDLVGMYAERKPKGFRFSNFTFTSHRWRRGQLGKRPFAGTTGGGVHARRARLSRKHVDEVVACGRPALEPALEGVEPVRALARRGGRARRACTPAKAGGRARLPHRQAASGLLTRSRGDARLVLEAIDGSARPSDPGHRNHHAHRSSRRPRENKRRTNTTVHAHEWGPTSSPVMSRATRDDTEAVAASRSLQSVVQPAAARRARRRDDRRGRRFAVAGPARRGTRPGTLRSTGPSADPIAGDAIATWPEVCGWRAFNLNLARHTVPLRRMAALEPRVVGVGHGDPTSRTVDRCSPA
jgi:hypothetical protein